MKLLLLLLIGFFNANPDPIAAGDAYFLQMNYSQALAQYQLAPTNADAQWKMARAYICQADISPLNKQKALYYKAVDAARQCIKINEKNSNGHTWLGAALGNIANYEGSKTKVKLCTTIKQELERALALNPQDDIALSILGSFYRALGNITWLERTLANTFLGTLPKGGFSEGEAAFRKAIQLSPGTLRHWFELGLLYQEWGKNYQALQIFQSAQQLPVSMASDKNRLTQIRLILSDKQL
jgi:tetratricopeptide (TPR) repeat protein